MITQDGCYGNSCKDGRWTHLAQVGFTTLKSSSTRTDRESLLMRNVEVEVLAYFTVIFSAINRTGLFVSHDLISFKARFYKEILLVLQGPIKLV